MNTILTIAAIYYSGFAIALFIAMHNIKKFKTNDNPFFAAFFSWLIIIVVACIGIYKLFKKQPNKDNY